MNIVLIIASLLASASAMAAPACLLVFDLRFPDTMPADNRAMVENLLLEALSQKSGMAVLGRDDLRTMAVAIDEVSKAKGCMEAACLLDVEALLDTRFFLSLDVAVLDGKQIVSARVFDRATNSIPVRVSESLGGDVAGMRTSLRALAGTLGTELAPLVAGGPIPAPPAVTERGFSPMGRIGFWVAGGGLGLLAAGGAVGGIAAIQAKSVEQDASGFFTNMPAARSARTLGWVANGLWLAGGLAVVGGGTLAILGWGDVELSVGPHSGMTVGLTL